MQRSNSNAQQADCLAVASTAAAPNVDNMPSPPRLDSKGDRRPELDSASETSVESRTESESRCVVS